MITVFLRKSTLYLSLFFLGIGFLVLNAPVCFAQSIDNSKNPFVNEDHTGLANNIDVVGLQNATVEKGNQKDALINVIKSVVNRTLGILGLIALLMLLYGGFQMVTAAGNEDQYGAGFKILKQAAFGLAIIGISWFIISIIFFVINLATVNAPVDSGDTLAS